MKKKKNGTMSNDYIINHHQNMDRRYDRKKQVTVEFGIPELMNSRLSIKRSLSWFIAMPLFGDFICNRKVVACPVVVPVKTGQRVHYTLPKTDPSDHKLMQKEGRESWKRNVFFSS